jgi:hypothetical protein
MEQPDPTFLDVPRLLDASMPKPRQAWATYAMITFVLVVLTTALASQGNPQIQGVARFVGGVVMLGVVLGMGMLTSHTLKLARREQQQVEAIEELVQLRRWDQAATMLDALFALPMRSQGTRLQGLIYMSSVLARYHRFGDAIAVQDYLLSHAEFEPGTAHGIKLMRAMAMLHEDHLFDADKAISDLRREMPDSAGLALIEIYRDVKTGHPAEAIDAFHAKLPAMRGQLGHRVGDAYALIARAHDLQGQEREAAVAWEKATLLASPDELYRRYPEVAAIRDKYPAAPAPKEAA